MSGLPPIVIGALIAGGFAIVGGGMAAMNTRATLRANRDVERDRRLWEKKSALYEELYAAADELQKVLHGWHSMAMQLDESLDEATAMYWVETRQKDEAARWSEANLYGLRARIHLYAGDKVGLAFNDLLRNLQSPDDGLKYGPAGVLGKVAPQSYLGQLSYRARVDDQKRELQEEMRLDLQQEKPVHVTSPAMFFLMSVRHPITRSRMRGIPGRGPDRGYIG
jgi:hypothetical protein